MRTQSMKTLTATLTLAALITIAVPAHARPAQPRFGESFARTIRTLVNRVLGGITSNGLPTTPIPATQPEPTTNGLPTTPIPVVPMADQQ